MSLGRQTPSTGNEIFRFSEQKISPRSWGHNYFLCARETGKNGVVPNNDVMPPRLRLITRRARNSDHYNTWACSVQSCLPLGGGKRCNRSRCRALNSCERRPDSLVCIESVKSQQIRIFSKLFSSTCLLTKISFESSSMKSHCYAKENQYQYFDQSHSRSHILLCTLHQLV